MPPPLRLLNRRIGQPRRLATAAILPSRVGRPRIADQVHQRDIFVTVGVEVAVLEVDPVLAGELLHRGGLTRAPQNRLLTTPPVRTPSSSVSNLLVSVLGMPRKRATGSTWMVSADELSTTVWPRARCARTNSRISG